VWKLASRCRLSGSSRMALKSLGFSLLHRPHTLNGHGDAQSHEVIELKRLGGFELVEENLNAPELGVHNSEQQLDAVVGRAGGPNHPVCRRTYAKGRIETVTAEIISDLA